MLVVTMDIPRSHCTYYLAQHREDFIGTVKIIFQPAEEGPGGAKPMIEAGVLRIPMLMPSLACTCGTIFPCGGRP